MPPSSEMALAIMARHCSQADRGRLHSTSRDPHLGIARLGQLGNQPRHGNYYEPEDVQRMMRELWEEFVAKNPDMFKT